MEKVKRITDEVAYQVIVMRLQLVSWRHIGRAIGIPDSTLRAFFETSPRTRLKVRLRAGGHCELCKVKDGHDVWRDRSRMTKPEQWEDEDKMLWLCRRCRLIADRGGRRAGAKFHERLRKRAMSKANARITSPAEEKVDLSKLAEATDENYYDMIKRLAATQRRELPPPEEIDKKDDSSSEIDK